MRQEARAHQQQSPPQPPNVYLLKRETAKQHLGPGQLGKDKDTQRKNGATTGNPKTVQKEGKTTPGKQFCLFLGSILQRTQLQRTIGSEIHHNRTLSTAAFQTDGGLQGKRTQQSPLLTNKLFEIANCQEKENWFSTVECHTSINHTLRVLFLQACDPYNVASERSQCP
ncbi:hypothetical protein STEG23_003743 [Scotinomys teguina]